MDRALNDSGEAERLNRCLSLVAHHDEVQVIIAVVEKLLTERTKAVEPSEEEDMC